MEPIMMVKNDVSQGVSGYDLRSQWVETQTLLYCNTHKDNICRTVLGNNIKGMDVTYEKSDATFITVYEATVVWPNVSLA